MGVNYTGKITENTFKKSVLSSDSHRRLFSGAARSFFSAFQFDTTGENSLFRDFSSARISGNKAWKKIPEKRKKKRKQIMIYGRDSVTLIGYPILQSCFLAATNHINDRIENITIPSWYIFRVICGHFTIHKVACFALNIKLSWYSLFFFFTVSYLYLSCFVRAHQSKFDCDSFFFYSIWTLYLIF